MLTFQSYYMGESSPYQLGKGFFFVNDTFSREMLKDKCKYIKIVKYLILNSCTFAIISNFYDSQFAITTCVAVFRKPLCLITTIQGGYTGYVTF